MYLFRYYISPWYLKSHLNELLLLQILIFFYMQKLGRAMRSQNLYQKGIKTEASEFFLYPSGYVSTFFLIHELENVVFSLLG